MASEDREMRPQSHLPSRDLTAGVRAAGGRAKPALTAMLGAGAALGLAGDAAADVVPVPADAHLAIDPAGNLISPTSSLSFDLDGVNGVDVAFQSPPSTDPFSFDMVAQAIVTDGSSPVDFVTALQFGNLVPAVGSVGLTAAIKLAANLNIELTTGGGTGDGNFENLVDPLYAGFYFTDDMDGIHAAWARLEIEFAEYVDASNVHYDNAAILRITGIAYESTAGASLLISAVPESTLGALGAIAAGAAGIGWRRRARSGEPATAS